MEITTNLKIIEIVDILNGQIDPIPSYFWTRIRKTTQICGRVDSQGFELRNNTFHMYSLRAIARFFENSNSTTISINFQEPPIFYNFWGQLLCRYKQDKKIILSFLKDWLKVPERTNN